ncbi:hypothetical protein [Streptomyces marianii]|uniref:hypothetical protein n=1 Tax=Streptomyces marianii TaxID=1817406 RepID=UPI001F42DCE3|nr:hypothetical protein [Streptomyces marianii]
MVASPTDWAEQPETSASADAVTKAPQTVPSPRQDASVNPGQPEQPAKKAATAKKAAAKAAKKAATGKPAAE